MTRAVSRPALPRAASSRGSGSARKSTGPARSLGSDYWSVSESPLHSLGLVLPMLIIFEIGTALHRSDPIAFHMLQMAFYYMGASGRFLPGMALVVVLLCWHLARKDRWKLDLAVVANMALESVLLAIPLLVLEVAMARWRIHGPLRATLSPWQDDVILSLGAGIYEEMVFRLMLITLLVLLLNDILRLPKNRSMPLIVACSAISFSLYHYLGNEPFSVQTFIFRTVAGIYFSILFMVRGFGITSACHSVYDIIIVALVRVGG